MVRVSSQQGCLFKIWQFLLLLWEIVNLFVVSLFRGNPRDARKADATPFRTSSYRPGGGGGGGSGGGGGNGGAPPGSNIKGLPRNRGVMRMPMGGGG
jgi:hypothetical protein